MVTNKGRPRTGEGPQKPRYNFSVSIPFEDKPCFDEFKENCLKVNISYSRMILQYIKKANQARANAFISKKDPEVDSTEETAQEDVSENEEVSKEVSELSEVSESEDEVEEDLEEKSDEDEEEDEKNIQEEIEEKEDVES